MLFEPRAITWDSASGQAEVTDRDGKVLEAFVTFRRPFMQGWKVNVRLVKPPVATMPNHFVEYMVSTVGGQTYLVHHFGMEADSKGVLHPSGGGGPLLADCSVH